MIDIHMHSNTSEDSKLEINEMIRIASEKNMDLICITNHHEPHEIKQNDYHQSMTDEELNYYKKQIDDYKANLQKSSDSNKMKVYFGVELSYIKKDEEFIKEFISENEFDYVLGTMHYVNGLKVADSRNFGKLKDNAVDEYFKSLRKLIKSDCFDMIAHLDIFRRVISDYNFDDYVSQWKEVANLMLKHNIGFEINTSRGLEEKGEFYPQKKVIEFLIGKGVTKITFGSDSHTYERIGDRYEEVVNFLKSLGIEKIVYFDKRKECSYSI